MKNNYIVATVVLIAVVIGFLIYFTIGQNKDEVKTPTVVVEKSSAVGCYVVHLQKDMYTLVIDKDTGGVVEGRIAYNNYEKDSSSGTFEGTFDGSILLGNYSFDSEGSHSDRQLIFKKVGDDFVQGYGEAKTVSGKEVFVNTSTVTYDPKSTFVKSADCTENFTDSNNIFTFDYNSFFKAYEGQNILSIDWRGNTNTKGVLLSSVSTSKPYMPNTNFSSARLTVGRSTDIKEIKSCMTDAINGEVKDGSRTIDGYTFSKFLLGDAGAGNFYDTVSYRGIVDGDCYVLEYTIHSTNIANYSIDQGIKEFDKTKITNEFEKIIDSFGFLVSSS